MLTICPGFGEGAAEPDLQCICGKGVSGCALCAAAFMCLHEVSDSSQCHSHYCLCMQVLSTIGRGGAETDDRLAAILST